MSENNKAKTDFDVALSFAGEDRAYVRSVADSLKALGVRVFYDEYEEASLWGKDLYQHLDYVYRKAAKYCVLFISRHYASRLWPQHELKSAQARAFQENEEYLLPARFDETELPGLRPTVGYINLAAMSPTKLAHLIGRKVGLDIYSRKQEIGDFILFGFAILEWASFTNTRSIEWMAAGYLHLPKLLSFSCQHCKNNGINPPLDSENGNLLVDLNDIPDFQDAYFHHVTDALSKKNSVLNIAYELGARISVAKSETNNAMILFVNEISKSWEGDSGTKKAKLVRYMVLPEITRRAELLDLNDNKHLRRLIDLIGIQIEFIKDNYGASPDQLTHQVSERLGGSVIVPDFLLYFERFIESIAE